MGQPYFDRRFFDLGSLEHRCEEGGLAGGKRRKPKIIQDKRKPKIIKDKKKRGEWAESVFLSRASEEGLPASKPWGDSRSFDCVVGRPGKFVAVQVKCTIARLESGEGYICSVCSSHKPYPAGSFDFVAAYVIPEDAWYIIPEKEIRGLKSISLCTVGAEAKYEPYREAWGLLRKASEIRRARERQRTGCCAGNGCGASVERGGTDANGRELFQAVYGAQQSLFRAKPGARSRARLLETSPDLWVRSSPPFERRREG